MPRWPVPPPNSEQQRTIQLVLTAESNRRLDECQGIVAASRAEDGKLTKAETIRLAIDYLWMRLRNTRDKVRRAVRDVERESGREKKKRPSRIQLAGRSCGLDDVDQADADELKGGST